MSAWRRRFHRVKRARSISLRLIAVTMLACVSASPAYAQSTLTWDVNGVVAGTGGALAGGAQQRLVGGSIHW